MGFIDRRMIRYFDWGLLLAALLVPMLGLIVLYSAGADPDAGPGLLPFAIKSQPFIKQGTFILAGIFIMGVALSISPQFLSRYAYVIYGVGSLLLLVVNLAGTVVNGSRRWIPLVAGFNLQPAELMKLGIILPGAG